MNLFLIGIIIFVIVYLFLNWFARTSSKKIATTIKKIAVYFSLILALLLTIGGKYIFSLPFLFVILSGLKIKGFTALQMFQLWRLIQFLKNSGRFSQGQVKTEGSSSVSLDEAYKLFENNNCNLIDVREINELENSGKVQGANHMPRGMLEVYLDPNSPAIHNGQLDLNKEFVLFCAGGVRSALAVKSLKEMGYEKISHIDGGFAAMSNSRFKII